MPKISFNSPLVLLFVALSFAALLLDRLLPGVPVIRALTLDGSRGVVGWANLVTYVFAHASWGHFANNMIYILLLGPMLEEKHGAVPLAAMAGVTAIVSGLVSLYGFHHGLLGASGIVFMLILLASFRNSRAGTVPVTFLLIAPLFLAREVVQAFGDDDVSQLAHLLGGAFGAGFGYLRRG
jgi:membrane associated rhomboid family serine protease